jgi:hypothetical protein
MTHGMIELHWAWFSLQALKGEKEWIIVSQWKAILNANLC